MSSGASFFFLASVTLLLQRSLYCGAWDSARELARQLTSLSTMVENGISLCIEVAVKAAQSQCWLVGEVVIGSALASCSGGASVKDFSDSEVSSLVEAATLWCVCLRLCARVG